MTAMDEGGYSAPPGMFGKLQEDKAIAALSRIARALERLADAQQQIAEQSDLAANENFEYGAPQHLGQRSE